MRQEFDCFNSPSLNLRRKLSLNRGDYCFEFFYSFIWCISIDGVSYHKVDRMKKELLLRAFRITRQID